MTGRRPGLPLTEARAAVINVDTDVAAALALGSIHKHTSLPAVLVNCAPTDHSRAVFRKLQDRWGFDIVEQPLRSHGKTLDWLFEDPGADKVLLLDSDAEVLDGMWVAQMLRYLDRRKVFGAGFVKHANLTGSVYVPERPYSPCMMLRTRDVQQAREAGISFEMRIVYNDFRFSRRLAKALAARLDDSLVWAPPDSRVRRVPEPLRSRLARSTLPLLSWARAPIDGLRPSYVIYDTATDVYRWCTKVLGHFFAGLPQGCLKGEVVHHGPGVSRHRHDAGGPFLTPLSDIEVRLAARLDTEHGIRWQELEREADLR